jgi:shikimate dehydrogenase
MTKLCVVVTGDDADAMVTHAQAAVDAGADMVELRLDLMSDPAEELHSLVGALKALLRDVDLAASLRAPRDGGSFSGTEEERLGILAELVSTGVGWVDLEGYLSPSKMHDLSDGARRAGSRVLVSWHVGREEDWDDVGIRCRASFKDGLADAVKVVLPVEDRQGLDAYLAFAWSLSREGISHVLLPTGRLSRLGRALAPVTGTGWVYTEASREGYQGPLGIPRFDEISSAWQRMGLRELPAGPARPPPPLEAEDGSGDWALLALLGNPVAHTNSPVVHHAAMRALGMRGAYVPYRTEPGDVSRSLDDLEAAGALGCNVTVPLKVEAAASVDRLGGTAQRSGAVNTVIFDGNGLARGVNTDVDGVALATHEVLGQECPGCTALVLGTGGAARGAVVGLHELGARVLVTGRNPDHLAGMIADMEGLAEPVNPLELDGLKGQVDVMVQCTSQGMSGVPPSGHLMPVRVMEEVAARAVLDIVYAPGGTDLVRGARLAGVPAAGGERVLLHQAAVGFRYWTGRDPPVERMEHALLLALGQ